MCVRVLFLVDSSPSPIDNNSHNTNWPSNGVSSRMGTQQQSDDHSERDDDHMVRIDGRHDGSNSKDHIEDSRNDGSNRKNGSSDDSSDDGDDSSDDSDDSSDDSDDSSDDDSSSSENNDTRNQRKRKLTLRSQHEDETRTEEKESGEASTSSTARKRRKTSDISRNTRQINISNEEEFGVSRGVDFKDVKTVVNFDLPVTFKNYTHRGMCWFTPVLLCPVLSLCFSISINLVQLMTVEEKSNTFV